MSKSYQNGLWLAATIVLSWVPGAFARMAINWATPSGFTRADALTPLLDGGSALVQLIYSVDAVADPADVDGATTVDDVVLAEAVMTSGTASAAGQHFAAVYTNATSLGYVYLRVFDTGTAPMAVPPGTAYFNSAPTFIMDSTLPALYQEVNEGAFAQGTAQDGSGRYVLDQVIAGGGFTPPPPYFDVTNEFATVGFAVSNLVVGGFASNLLNLIRWQDPVQGRSGAFPVESPWSCVVPLAVRTNFIYFSGVGGVLIPQSTNALDLASDSAYSDGWTTGDNGGTGFGAWTLGTTSGDVNRNGHFVGSSPQASITAPSWGLYANQNQTASALRPLPSYLTTNQVLSLEFENGLVDGVSSVGVELLNSATQSLCVFYYQGGEGWYRAGTNLTTINFTTNGLRLDFQLYTPDQMLLTVTPVNGGRYRTYLSTLTSQSDQLITRLRVWNYSAGENSDHDLFLNRLQVTTVTKQFTDSRDETLVVIRTPPASTLDITNVNATVRYGVSTTVVGGVASALTGQMRWTNTLNGAAGTLAASPAWSFSCPLAVGANAITVVGTNEVGGQVSDSVTLTRGGLGTDQPVLDIGNANETVANATSNLVLAGTANLHVVGSILWTNSAGGTGVLAAGTNWSFLASLAVGTNTITVSGSNLWSEVANDVVVIIRSAPAAAPYLDITNANAGVANAVSNFTLGGISSNLNGQLRWTNQLSGAYGSQAAAGSWSIVMPLAVGTNLLVVTGTNGTGQSVSDSVTIVRSNITADTISINWYAWAGFVQPDGMTPLLFGAPKSTYALLINAGPNGLVDPVNPCNPTWWLGGDDTLLEAKLLENLDDMDPMLSYAANDYGLYSAPAPAPIVCYGRIFQDTTPAPGEWYYNSMPAVIPLGTMISPPTMYDLNSNGMDPDLVNLVVPACGPAVNLDITNQSASVGYAVSNLTVGGVASNAVGQMRWTNQLNGANGTLAAASTWSFFAPLAVGSNLITVAATNASGTAASDVVIITRQAAPVPSLVIATLDQTVGFAVSNLFVEGTSSNLVGSIRWTNLLSGVSGSLSAASSWSLVAPIALGANMLILSGSNGVGQTASDTVTVTRVSLPVLDVTNTPVGVRYSTTNWSIGGVHSGLVGQLRWTNALTGGNGTVAVVSPFGIGGIALAVGSNLITVQGTNLYGDAASDSVTITRGGIGTDLPTLDVTTANQSVGNAVSNMVISGTANLHVVGQISWFNMLSGPGGSFAAGTNWLFMASLAVGTNTIIVSGSNLWSETTIDVVTIIRGPSASAGPVLDITNLNQVVAQAVSNLVVGGISSNLVGQIRWTNSLNGANGTLAAASSWSFVTPLAVGMNTITMRGTNLLGDAATDAAYVMRSSDAVPSGMVLIPAGSFVMGNVFTSDVSASESELPRHTVNISAFHMDVYEVTKALWDEVKAFNGGNGYAYSNTGLGKAPNHPVHSVSWFDVVKWCNARSEREGLTPCYSSSGVVYRTGIDSNVVCDWSANGYRLPTNAEWEKAARGGAADTRFPWTDYTNNISHAKANYDGHTFFDIYELSDGYHPAYSSAPQPYTSPVGSFAPNGYGLYDMAGNVWESCWDFYDGTYYASSPASDPRGPAGPLSGRVRRGGAWDYFAFSARVAFRSSVAPDYAEDSLGFRCARGTGTVDPGSPFIDITNASETVGFAVASRSLGGLASNVVGVLTWSNHAGQVGGTIPAAALWSIPGVSLAVGANSIVVQGSNEAGNVASDTVTLTRVAAPVLDITNINAGVRYSTTNWNIGGVFSGLVGQLRWTNALTGGNGTVAAGSPFGIGGIALAVGSNLITVSGTNLYGDGASDSVSITRGGLGTDLPSLDITNENQTVAGTVSTLTLGGTANAHVVGQMTWSNSLGGAGSFTAVPAWSIPLTLDMGTNIITVRGSNLWSEVATDVVVIARAEVPLPVLIITNVEETVDYAVSNYTLGGYAADVSGHVVWSNVNNGATGVVPADSNWSLECPLNVGTNMIVVTASNIVGQIAEDVAFIARAVPMGPGTVSIDWYASMGFVQQDGYTPLLFPAPKGTYVLLMDAGPNGMVDPVKRLQSKLVDGWR
jgi:sulfatase modifying factor 1